MTRCCPDPRVSGAFHSLVHDALSSSEWPVVVVATSAKSKMINPDLHGGFLHQFSVDVSVVIFILVLQTWEIVTRFSCFSNAVGKSLLSPRKKMAAKQNKPSLFRHRASSCSLQVRWKFLFSAILLQTTGSLSANFVFVSGSERENSKADVGRPAGELSVQF